MSANVVVIDYGSGNIASLCNALERISTDYIVSNKADKIRNAKKIIFPGVGRAGYAVKKLYEQDIFHVIKECKIPFLGICLGMQLLSDSSLEDDVECMGIISGIVKPIPPIVRVPHIGWNRVNFLRNSPLIEGIKDNSFFYYVNSFYFDVEEEFIVAKTNYGISFPAIVQHKNFYAVQFHPEKSGKVGLKLLKNFIDIE